MPITVTPNPTLARRLKRDRTTMRQWAKRESSPSVLVETTFCWQLREIADDPLRVDLQLAAAKTFMEIAARHGAYAQF